MKFQFTSEEKDKINNYIKKIELKEGTLSITQLFENDLLLLMTGRDLPEDLNDFDFDFTGRDFE